jgi:hypothetical protein
VKDFLKTIPETEALLKKEESKVDAFLDKIKCWKSEKGWEKTWEANPYLQNLHPSFDIHSGNAKILKCQSTNLEGKAKEFAQELLGLKDEEKEIQDCPRIIGAQGWRERDPGLLRA